MLHLFLCCLALLLSPAKPDPDPLQDYCVADNKTPQSVFINGVPCINPNLASASHFKTSVLGKPAKTSGNPFGFNVTLTGVANLPGVNTMGLIMVRGDIAGNGLIPPHSHPRASEVTICLTGSVLVGFVDTSRRLYTQQLRPGESFVFPKGLIHFLFNLDSSNPALVLSGLNSQNPGTQITSLAAFTSNPLIPDEVLRKAFQINGQDIAKIHKNLGG
ncbi:germin-like protein subfamily 1 member 1 [Pistacia vera]|uniref:germin-like protein subfamily 1 member 1 n=1 Tax=Pistacia vera TaxID=55513 RepID=UPI001263818A|nr:germin-like protein subfamily 1 member 1 [Pistacia vera]